jgi:hypothetical protein
MKKVQKITKNGKYGTYIIDVDTNLKGEPFVIVECEGLFKTLIGSLDESYEDVITRCITLVDNTIEESIQLNKQLNNK